MRLAAITLLCGLLLAAAPPDDLARARALIAEAESSL